MREELQHPGNEENLQAENEFLKMKLMLEQGAHFGPTSSEHLPAGIENQFLRNIIEFEKQFQEHKKIKVFEKIKRPSHFKPVAGIAESEIENEWNTLQEYLGSYGIELSACSPNVTPKELYRFTTEELFNYEMDDMDLPGMMNCFIYDEFYPDHIYENTRTAVDECMGTILEKQSLKWMHHYSKGDLRLNKNFPLTKDEFRDKVNRFKLAYDGIELVEIKEPICTIEENVCRVNGEYTADAILNSEKIVLQGNWIVEFKWEKELEYWDIVNVQVEGIDF